MDKNATSGKKRSGKTCELGVLRLIAVVQASRNQKEVCNKQLKILLTLY